MSADRLCRTLLACALCSAALACSDDKKPAPRRMQTGDIQGDAGGEPDGGPPDSSDIEDRDHVLESDDVVLCGYDDEDVTVLPAHASLAALAAANDDRGFALVRHDPDGALVIDAFELGESPDAPVRLARPDQAPDAPLLRAADQRFFLLYREGNALMGRLLVDGQGPRELASDLSELPEGGLAHALAAQPDRFVVAFLRGEARSVHVQAFDLDGEPLSEASELRESSEAGHVALARLDAGRMLLALQEPDPEAAGEARVRAQVLSEELEADGSERTLSKRSVDVPRFALAARALSAGLVHARLEGGVRETLDYQRIEPSGEALDATLSLVNAPRRGRDAAITDFGQGYAIAYRALPSLGVQGASIKVAFINQFGRIVHEATLAETSEEPSEIAISATREGHVLVAFRAVAGEAVELTATRMHCPGALVLCGGALE